MALYEGSNLGKAQEEILHLLVEQRLTPEQIAQARKVHISGVHRAIRKLKKMGLIRSEYRVSSAGPVPPGAPTFISAEGQKMYYRLHGEQWDVRVPQMSAKFCAAMERGNSVPIWGNKVMFYPHKMEVWAHKFLFFEHPNDVKACTEASIEYWDRFFLYLEEQYQIILLKDKRHNVNRVKSHYAQVHNGFAKEINNADKWFHVRSEDGRLRFIVDKSFNNPELEAVDGMSAATDMERVGPHMINIADNPQIFLPSQNHEIILGLVNHKEHIAKEFKELIEAEKNRNETVPDSLRRLEVLFDRQLNEQHRQNMIVTDAVAAVLKLQELSLKQKILDDAQKIPEKKPKSDYIG